MKRGSQLLRELVSPREKQENVASACGVTQQAVSTWAHGSAKPTYERMVILRDLYGIPLESWAEEATTEEEPTEEPAAQ